MHDARDRSKAMDRNLEIRTAGADEFDAALRLLQQAGLPVEDLAAERLPDFLVAAIGERLAGIVGLERFGRTGLLRSLVVDPGMRSAGLGRVLVAALESKARAAGIVELWLLTIDADAYFARLGYVTESREKAPDSIRGTEEFANLCPGDAVLMKKTL